MYEKTPNGVKRLSDGACIPASEQNADYRRYLAWVEYGNEPRPICPSEYHKWHEESSKYVADEAKSNELCRRLKNEVNLVTKEKIIYGFSFKDKKVLLSVENQLSFKSAYDLRESLTFPHRVRAAGEYLTFEDTENYAEFYKAVAQHILSCIEQGYKEKDALDEKNSVELIEYLEENFLTEQGVAKCLDNSYTAWS